MRKPFLHFFLLSLLLSSVPAFSQGPPDTDQSRSTPPAARKRLKIGVALEGGGALGLAHIGVLQWFEDHRIPVDYIAGTSMGGLVGGLYATGKSPAELKSIVEQQNWDIIIGGTTAYADLSYRRKEDARAFQSRLEFGLKHGFSLPSGLNSGQGVSLLIDRETLAYAHTGSFDNFPIPFRCVATNLTTGDAVVFDHGSIAQALRSTMSIPGVFAPVREGQNIYVDGGLLGNLPTDVVRKMGADLVVAVHLSIAPADPNQIQSLFSVLGRSVEVVIHENELRGLAGADLVINVDLRDYNSIQYDQARAIMEQGSRAAQQKSDVLAPFALNDEEWTAYLDQRNRRKKTLIPTPEFVEVRGTNAQTSKALEVFLRPLIGKPVDQITMQDMLDRLTGIGKFDSVDYWLSDENGKIGLFVAVHEKVYAPPSIQLGFVVDGSEPYNVTFTQAARLTLLDVVGYRSEWRTDGTFGNTYSISSELFRPFTPMSKWFFAPRASASDAAFYFFQKTKPVSDYRYDRLNVGGDLGYQFSRFTEFRFGYDTGYTNVRLLLGQSGFMSVTGRLGDSHITFRTDHTDDPTVPRRGYSADFKFHWYDAYPGNLSGGLPSLDGRFNFFQPISPNGSVFLSGEGATTFGVINIGFPLYFLGGPLRLSAYGTNELYGEQYYLVRAGYIRQLFNLPPFVGKKVSLVSSYEFAKMYDFLDESHFPTDVEAGVVAETMFGPLFVGGSVGDSGHQKWFFQLGHIF
jgi:NTE family protein